MKEFETTNKKVIQQLSTIEKRSGESPNTISKGTITVEEKLCSTFSFVISNSVIYTIYLYRYLSLGEAKLLISDKLITSYCNN